jgi:hypothetical protein
MRSSRVIAVAAALCLYAAASATGAERCPVDCSAFGINSVASQPLQSVPIPPALACTSHLSHGLPVPDPACTPGAVNPTLSADTLSGFRTCCIRNNATSEGRKAATYDWYGALHPANNTGQNQTCELDHLVPLELGGADTLDNIWPQCGPDDVSLKERYFKLKDTVENYLAYEVKIGGMSLDDAQRGIATDWTQYLDVAQAMCPGGRCPHQASRYPPVPSAP